MKTAELSARKIAMRDFYERYASERAMWLEKSKYFHESDLTYMRFLVPKGSSVLQIGCGIGNLLAGLEPSRGVGIDISPRMIGEAKRRYPKYRFFVADAEDPAFAEAFDEPFDAIVLFDVIGNLEDCDRTLSNLRPLCRPDTRIIIAYYNRLWEPILKFAERLGQKMPAPPQNWLFTGDIVGLLRLTGYETIRREWRQLIPARLFGVGHLINRYVAPLPVIGRACLR